MGDWGNAQQGLVSGFQIGQKTGGKMAGLGSVLSKVAEELKAQRQQKEALNLLGQTEAIKAQHSEWKPKTQQEALEFEKAKRSIDFADLPEGFVSVGGKAYKDPTYKRQPSQEERVSELNDKVAEKELTAMASALPKLDQADQAVSQLEELFKAGATPDNNPIMARVSGVGDAIKAKAGFNPSLNTYMSNRAGFSGLIAKGGFGEAGMLTQQDIERIKKLLPSSMSTFDEASLAFKEIKQVLGSARQRFEQKKQQYTGQGTSNNQQPDLSSMSIEELKRIAGEK